MPAPTLKALALKSCMRNKDDLWDMGGLYFSQCHEILRQIKNPAQLHAIEEASPHIQEDTGPLWKAIIARQIPDYQTMNWVPKEPTGWYKVFLKYKRWQQREVEKAANILNAGMMAANAKKAGRMTQTVDFRTMPPLPRDMKPDHRAKSSNPRFRKEAPSSLNFGGGVGKLTDGKSVVARARREAQAMRDMKRLSRPTAELGGNIRQVKAAPKGLVAEYQRAARPTVQVGPVRIVARKPIRTVGPPVPVSQSLQDEREARLRALASSKRYVPAAGENVISSDSEDDEEFDAPVARPTGRPPPNSRPNQRPSQNILAMPFAKPASARPPTSVSRPSPQAKPIPRDTSATSTARASQPPPSESPRPGSSAPANKVIMRKRAPVDPFNRTQKRPRRA